ncbi:MAG TPA: GNAT family N-acetyltransferase [Chloroflexi bacterium]|nr:GNAT family N-acetyltransferase [Chloroflexota bacterium]
MPVPQIVDYRHGEYALTTDPARIHKDAVYRYLSEEAYWSRGLPREIFERSVEHSFTFSLLCGEEQAGFARVISDFATFAYLADVFVLPAHRGQGLGKWMVARILEHPDLQNLRTWLLTRDAHGLYSRFGFKPLDPGRGMVKRDPDVYTRLRETGR